MAYETNTPEANPNDPSSMGERAAGAAAEAQAAASELGRKAARKAEQIRGRTAEGLESAARSMHQGGARVASAADRTADALTAGADYVRENELRDMMDDIIEVVRNNPGPALLGAAALGFLIGRAVSRS